MGACLLSVWPMTWTEPKERSCYIKSTVNYLLRIYLDNMIMLLINTMTDSFIISKCIRNHFNAFKKTPVNKLLTKFHRFLKSETDVLWHLSAIVFKPFMIND